MCISWGTGEMRDWLLSKVGYADYTTVADTSYLTFARHQPFIMMGIFKFLIKLIQYFPIALIAFLHKDYTSSL